MTEVAISVAAYMSLLGKVFESFEEAQEAVRDIVLNGKALDTFKRFIASQGGDPNVVDQPELLPTAAYHFEVLARKMALSIRSMRNKSVLQRCCLVQVERRRKIRLIMQWVLL